MKIIYGNITNADGVDFIVNASNTRLILGSGVSMAIKRHCGFEIEREMALFAPINLGDVVKTSAGKATNFKALLHAAITDIKIPTTIQVVHDALINIDKYCTQNSKLAIPLLGTGSGKLDKIEVMNLFKTFFEDVKYEVNVYILP